MSQPRTISFFGSGRLLSELTPRATYLRTVIQGLQGRGFHFTFFAPEASDVGLEDRSAHGWVQVAWFSADTEHHIRRALAEAASADIIIKSSSVGSCDTHLDRVVLEVAPPRTQVIYWDLNPAQTLMQVLTDSEHPFRPLIPKYDLILTFGGGAPAADAYQKLGARLCVPIHDGQSAGEGAPSVGDLDESDLDCPPTNEWFEHRVRELEVVLRPAALQQPLPA